MDETLGDAETALDAELDEATEPPDDVDSGPAGPGWSHDGGALAIAALALACGAMLLNVTSLRMGDIALRYVTADGPASEVTQYAASIVGPTLLLLVPAAFCGLLGLGRAPRQGWQRPVAAAALIVAGVVVLVLAVSVLALWASPTPAPAAPTF